MIHEESSKTDPSKIYDKSLSSLLFLAFGIFLLNSVNEIGSNLVEARSFNDDNGHAEAELDALNEIFENHPEISQLFLNEQESEQEQMSSYQTNGVNGFLRLVMNLANAYETTSKNETTPELACLWSAYCHQLNRQASYQGMMSTVARINSVGMRVLVKDVDSNEAIRAILSAMLRWQDLDCQAFFPDCPDGTTTTTTTTTEPTTTTTA